LRTRGAIPPLVFMAWCLVKYSIHIHGVVLSLSQGQLQLYLTFTLSWIYLHDRVQNGSRAHPASYPVGTRGSFLGSKVAGAWSWPLISI